MVFHWLGNLVLSANMFVFFFNFISSQKGGISIWKGRGKPSCLFALIAMRRPYNGHIFSYTKYKETNILGVSTFSHTKYKEANILGVSIFSHTKYKEANILEVSIFSHTKYKETNILGVSIFSHTKYKEAYIFGVEKNPLKMESNQIFL